MDNTIDGISIFDSSGNLVVSTLNRTRDDFEQEISFLRTLPYVSIGEAHIHQDFDAASPDKDEGISGYIDAVSPIIRSTDKYHIGFIINHIRLDGLEAVLIGKTQKGATLTECDFDFSSSNTHVITSKGRHLAMTCRHGLENYVFDVLPVKKCAQGEKTSTHYTDSRGHDIYGASACMDNGWVVLTEIDKSEIDDSLNKILRGMTLTGLWSSVMVLILVYWYTRRQLQPIVSLTQKIAKRKVGKQIKKIDGKFPGEISLLVQTFNTLSRKILNREKLLIKQKVKASNLAKELEKFKLAVDMASDQIVITDADAKILYANLSTKKITGFSVDEMIGKKSGTSDLWGGQMDEKFYKKLWNTIKIKKSTFSGEITNKRKNGEIYQAYSTIYPIVDTEQNVKFFVAIERDITKEKDVEKMKSDFIAVASHQLRAPISGIKWTIELLQQEKGIPKRSKKLIVGANERMDNLIELVDHLLNVSRIEKNTSVKPKKFDLVASLRENIEGFSPRTKRGNLSVSFDPKPKKIILMSDEKIIKTIFDSIFSNAIIHTLAGGSIAVTMRKQKDTCILKIRDTGIGIPRKDQKNIFLKFFRAKNAKKINTAGTGLGLYTAKMATVLLGGKISFTSQEGKGTTMTVVLPLKSKSKKVGKHLV